MYDLLVGNDEVIDSHVHVAHIITNLGVPLERSRCSYRGYHRY